MNVRKGTRHELTRGMKQPVAIGKAVCRPLTFARRKERRLTVGKVTLGDISNSLQVFDENWVGKIVS